MSSLPVETGGVAHDMSPGCQQLKPPLPREITQFLIFGSFVAARSTLFPVPSPERQAVQACRESTYDIILMDVMMPVMGGLEATREIRAEGGRNRTTPIIFVTANPMVSASSDQVGVMDTLYKPIMRQALFGALAKWLTEEHVVWIGDAWSKHVGALTTDYAGTGHI